MATKFVRDKDSRRERKRDNLPFQRSLTRLAISPKRRVFLIYIFVAAFLLCAVIFDKFGPWAGSRNANPRRAAGIVLEKFQRAEAGEERCFLRVQAPVGRNKTEIGDIALERAFWEGFVPGDQVMVLYEKDAATGEIRLTECGLFALRRGMQ